MAGKKGMHKKWLNDPNIRERVIAKIQNAGIAEMLVKYVKTGEGMDNQRASIALGLLRKVVPDLASQEITDRREGWLDVMKRVAELRQAKKSDVQPQQSTAAMPASAVRAIVSKTNESLDGANLHQIAQVTTTI